MKLYHTLFALTFVCCAGIGNAQQYSAKGAETEATVTMVTSDKVFVTLGDASRFPTCSLIFIRTDTSGDYVVSVCASGGGKLTLTSIQSGSPFPLSGLVHDTRIRIAPYVGQLVSRPCDPCATYDM